MTKEEAIKFLVETSFCGKLVGDKNLVDVCDLAISAIRDQEERESVWHDAKDNPPKKPGLYYGKKDDTDSMYLCQYRDGAWTLDAYPETRMHVIKWAYYNAFAQEQEERRWIPVTERLPENIANRVLVVCERSNGVFYAHYEKPFWINLETDKPFISTVTHWMPLPQPPKEV